MNELNFSTSRVHLEIYRGLKVGFQCEKKKHNNNNYTVWKYRKNLPPTQVGLYYKRPKIIVYA